jgi:hypothetical protein
VGPLPEFTTTSKGPLFPPLREDPPTPHIVALYHQKEGRKEGRKDKHKLEAYGVLSYATKL